MTTAVQSAGPRVQALEAAVAGPLTRLALWVIGPLLLIYAVGDRWMTWLFRVPGTPLFAGELFLALCVVVFAERTGELRLLFRREPVMWLPALFVSWVLIRLIPGFVDHGLIAIRDASVGYYPLVAIAVAGLGVVDPGLARRLIGQYLRWLPWIVTAIPIAYGLDAFFSFRTLPGAPVALFEARPANLAIHAGLAFVSAMMAPAGLLRESARVYVAIVAAGTIGVLATQNRSGFIAVGLMILIALVVRPGRSMTRSGWVFKVGAGLAVAATLVWVANPSLATDREGRTVSAGQFFEVVENLASGGTSGSATLRNTVQFRDLLWEAAVHEVAENDAEVFGLGFGESLGDDLVIWDGPGDLRNPHNSHLNIFARLGLIGAGLWIGMWLLWLIRVGARLVDARTAIDQFGASVAFSAVPAFLLVATFDPTLETPQAAFWLYTLVAIGILTTGARRSPRKEPTVRSPEPAKRVPSLAVSARSGNDRPVPDPVGDAPEGPKPIFLLSPPRSGSTYLQSVLGAHPDIGTAPEPWFLLHLAGLHRDQDHFARHNARFTQEAYADLERVAEERGASLDPAVRAFAMEAYAQLAPGARYFVDKTPRYMAIAPWLAEVFPDARFVVLFRDPRDVVSSIVETWGRGRWNVFLYEFDLFEGLPTLAAFAKHQADRVCTVSYENLVAEPTAELERVSSYLELETPLTLDLPGAGSGEDVVGRMGDPSGVQRYRGQLSEQSIGRWRTNMTGRRRAKWMQRYLTEVFPAADFADLYDTEKMVSELAEQARLQPDRASDLALVPLTQMWPTINRVSGFRAEDSLRSAMQRLLAAEDRSSGT